MISIICPSFERPKLCARMVKSAVETATMPIEFLIGIGSDLEQSAQYAEYHHELEGISTNITFMMTGQHSSVYVSNKLAAQAKGKIIYMVGDDCIFTDSGWDAALTQADKAVISLKDSRDENGTPHLAMWKVWRDAYKYFFCPAFLHFYADTELVDRAKTANEFVHIKTHTLTHDKPSDKGQPDNTHTRIRRMGWHERDREVYQWLRGR